MPCEKQPFNENVDKIRNKVISWLIYTGSEMTCTYFTETIQILTCFYHYLIPSATEDKITLFHKI